MSYSVDINKTPIRFIKGIGEQREKILNSLGIFNIYDLLFYFPYRYYDRTNVFPISRAAEALMAGISEELTFIGKIIGTKIVRTRYRQILEIVIEDNGYRLKALFFNAVTVFEKIFSGKNIVALSGKLSSSASGVPAIIHPKFDFIENIEKPDFINTGIIVPNYSLRNINQLKEHNFGPYSIRDIIARALKNYADQLQETLPSGILKEYSLMDIKETVKTLHYPKNFEELKKAKKRIKFEESFYFQIIASISHRSLKVFDEKMKFRKIGERAKKFIDKILPFELTADQKNVIKEIYQDFTSGYPMNRLLQGEVGSGKTIVVLISALIAADNGFQTAIMAPTEILANQHYITFSKLLKELPVNICILTGSTPKKIRTKYLEQIKNGEIDIIIGTHALLEEDIVFKSLGYVVVDEQHRFGVLQRAMLKNKGLSPHFLIMTATPIPRTLSMTMYSALDISAIKEMPKNRKPIKTYLVEESKRYRINEFIRKETGAGNSVYIVFPLVEESEKLELKDVISNYLKLKTVVFPDISVGMLHGQMNSAEKDDVMKKFVAGEIKILVCTTVVEVGIDNPNATVILIEEPQRFGLSQLHQLRGRVGRGEKQSYCILIAEEKYTASRETSSDTLFFNEEKELDITRKRLQVFVNNLDGFRISEEDLKLRGPGDILTTRQSGLPAFKYLDLAEDLDIILQTRDIAAKIINEDPKLIRPANSIIRSSLEKYRKELNISAIS